MFWNRMNEAGIAAVVRLSRVMRRMGRCGLIRKCGVGLLAAGLAGLASQAVAQSFPAEFELRSLFPALGGDGAEGFILKGVDVGDNSGRPVSGAGDINGDGTDDLIIGAYEADPTGQAR